MITLNQPSSRGTLIRVRGRGCLLGVDSRENEERQPVLTSLLRSFALGKSDEIG